MLVALVLFLCVGIAIASNTCCLPFNPTPLETLRASTKKSWAYYFPIFPISIDNKNGFTGDHYTGWMNVSDPHYGDPGKYYLTDRPFPRLPRSESNWIQLDAAVEVRRAISQGLDGFIYECPQKKSSNSWWNNLPAMLQAVQAVDPNFKIVLSIDRSTNDASQPTDDMVNTIYNASFYPATYKTSDGKVVMAPFYPETLPLSWWQEVESKLLQRGVKLALLPLFLSTNMPSFASWNNSIWGYSTWGTRWASGQTSQANNAAYAHNNGKISFL